MTLWGTAELSLDTAIVEFTVGDDPRLDLELLPYDCLASAAHARMLCSIGVLSEEELTQLIGGLRNAYKLACQQSLPIHLDDEDGHTALEKFLTKATGDAGKAIHTGRSRNDQVIMAMRLLLRHRLVILGEDIGLLTEQLITLVDHHRQVLMPGYTHTRQAMPSTVGQLFMSVAEGLLRDLETLRLPLQHANRCALGSASGYGVPLPLDRQQVADQLGLDAVDVNTLHVQNSRGRLEATTLFALHQMSQTLGRLATDLINFSSEAYGFFRLPEELTTGSSIMPNKRNPDVLELVRAQPSAQLGRYTTVSTLLQGLGGGYHRDLQRTKEPVLSGLREAKHVVAIMRHTVDRIEVDRTRCEAALEPGIFATDRAYDLVRTGMPFRDAYQQIKGEGSGTYPHAMVLHNRTHLGAPGTPQAQSLRVELKRCRDALLPFAQGHAQAELVLIQD
ncbi:MAG: argininosuccinate lyase [Myxococcota bacterium]